MKRSFPLQVLPILRGIALNRGVLFGVILIGALLAFEVFNYSTTNFALWDVFGDLQFLGVRWSTILTLAFCGIDFAGIARLFTPEKGRNETAEVWYLFAAWLLASIMNAMLTWWGVSIAIMDHNPVGAALVNQSTLTKAIPVFVAVMVWLIRVLIIGTLSIAGEDLFSVAEGRHWMQQTSHSIAESTRDSNLIYIRPIPKPISAASNQRINRRDPTYHPVGINAQSYDKKGGSHRE